MSVTERSIFVGLISILLLQGCGGRVLGNDPNASRTAKQHCTQVANQYLAENYSKIDPYWREQERYQQYRISNAQVNQ